MSAQELIQLLVPSMAGIITAILGIVALARNVRTQQADLAKKYQEIADKAIDDMYELRERVDRLEKNIRARDSYIEYLLRGITKLVEQLKDKGQTPVWIPEDRTFDE